MSGAYKSEKTIALEHTIPCLEHTNRFPWSIQFGYFFRKHEKNGPLSCLIAPTPKTRACIVTASLRHCLGSPPAHESQYTGRRHFCLCEYLQPDLVLERWGGLQTPCRNFTIGCPQNITRRSPPKTAPEDIPQGYPDVMLGGDPSRMPLEDIP